MCGLALRNVFSSLITFYPGGREKNNRRTTTPKKEKGGGGCVMAERRCSRGERGGEATERFVLLFIFLPAPRANETRKINSALPCRFADVGADVAFAVLPRSDIRRPLAGCKVVLAFFSGLFVSFVCSIFPSSERNFRRLLLSRASFLLLYFWLDVRRPLAFVSFNLARCLSLRRQRKNRGKVQVRAVREILPKSARLPLSRLRAGILT